MTNIRPMCADCRHYHPDSFCDAPIPQWIEMQGQSWEVRPNDDASDCACFEQDDSGTP